MHLLQRSGLMSIHTNARGERCEEQPRKLPATLPPEELRARSQAERDANRWAEKRAARGAKMRREPRGLELGDDDELEAAFDYANRDRRGENRAPSGFDRRIYAVPGSIRITSGGLPGTARSH